ncbi:MAG: alpha/beta hydrolase, partial [Ignavibacteriae bacterium]|nr:alpha/beta hydrolase [Ignavibacteriota bacterium]
NCLNEQIIELASYVSDEFNFVTGSFDFRHHGHSGNAPPTFGAAEARDIMSVLDYAESVNAPKPYILIGESLGALAIQRATIEDNRISGSVLLSSPGWPWDAIGKQIGLGVPVGKMIDKAYGYNILTDGDIRRHNSNPPHNPKILYIIGEKDMFDWRQTQKCFNHWYGTEGIINVWPKDLLEQNKWFIVAPGLEHPDDDNYNRALNIKNYPEIYGLIHQFMTLLLEKN